MGVDTCKLSYPMPNTAEGMAWLRDHRARFENDGWSAGKNYGTMGPLWWAERVHEDGTRVVVKGVGSDAHLLWEGSVPGYLGICGPAHPDDVRVIDAHLRRIGPFGLPAPFIRRLDVTEDVVDPHGEYRTAALGWNPHARSRYVQAVYQENETVWQHNKTRGVRVYDKFAEKPEEWARDLTRIEYQIRGAWLEKYGIDRLYSDFGRNADRALAPVVDDLRSRVRNELSHQACGPSGSAS